MDPNQDELESTNEFDEEVDDEEEDDQIDDEDGEEEDESESESDSEDGSDDDEDVDKEKEDEDEDEEPLKSPSGPLCYICLNEFNDQDVGSPDSCDGNHYFCLECIEEWSKQINTCPVDRKSFSFIIVRRTIGGNIIMKLPTKDNRIPDLSDVSFEDDLTYCEICGRCDREDRLLLCDGCDFGYHCECLSPPIETIPIEEWFCPECHHQMFGDASTNGNPPAIRGRRTQRAIARTRAFEVVRERIANRRTTTSSALASGTTSSLAQTIEAVASGTATTTLRTRKPLVKRRTRRRRRKTRRRKTTRRRTKAGLKGAKKGTKRRRRRKGKKRKSKKSRKSTRPLPPPTSTARRRIATRLGLGPPPKSPYGLPAMKSQFVNSIGGSTAPLGSLSLFGYELDCYDPRIVAEDFEVEDSGSVGVMARPRIAPRGLIKCHAIESGPTDASKDILSEIMNSQERLYSSDVTITRDGTIVHHQNPNSNPINLKVKRLGSTGSSSPKSSPSRSPSQQTDFSMINLDVPLVKPSSVPLKSSGHPFEDEKIIYSDTETFESDEDDVMLSDGDLMIEDDDDDDECQDKNEFHSNQSTHDTGSSHNDAGSQDNGSSNNDASRDNGSRDNGSRDNETGNQTGGTRESQNDKQGNSENDKKNVLKRPKIIRPTFHDVFAESESEDDANENNENKEKDKNKNKNKTPRKLFSSKTPMKIVLKKDKEKQEQIKKQEIQKQENENKKQESEIRKQDNDEDDFDMEIDDFKLEKDKINDEKEQDDDDIFPVEIPDENDFELVKPGASSVKLDDQEEGEIHDEKDQKDMKDLKEFKELKDLKEKQDLKIKRCKHGKILKKDKSHRHDEHRHHHRRSRSKEKGKNKNSDELILAEKKIERLELKDDEDQDKDVGWKKLSGSSKMRNYRDGKPKSDDLMFREREVKRAKKSSHKHHDKSYSRHHDDDKRKEKEKEKETKHHKHHHHKKKHKSDVNEDHKKKHKKHKRIDEIEEDEDLKMTTGTASKILQGSHGNYHEVIPLDSKEIYAEGDRIVINVNFKKDKRKDDNDNEIGESSNNEQNKEPKIQSDKDLFWVSPPRLATITTTTTTTTTTPKTCDSNENGSKKGENVSWKGERVSNEKNYESQKKNESQGQSQSQSQKQTQQKEIRFLPRSLHQEVVKSSSHGPHTPEGEYKDPNDNQDDDDQPTPTQDESPPSMSPSINSNSVQRSPLSPASPSPNQSHDVYDPEVPLNSPDQKKESSKFEVQSSNVKKPSSSGSSNSKQEFKSPSKPSQQSPFKSSQISPQKSSSSLMPPPTSLPPSNLMRPSGAAALATIATLNPNNLIQLIQMAQSLQKNKLTPTTTRSNSITTTTTTRSSNSVSTKQQNNDAITDVVDMDVSSPSPPQVSSSTSSRVTSSTVTPALNVQTLWDSLVKTNNQGIKRPPFSGLSSGKQDKKLKPDFTSSLNAGKSLHRHHVAVAADANKKLANSKIDAVTVLDDVPSSAVEMAVKEKFIKKLNRQERVVEEVKMVLKPFYQRRDVNKEEYKEILRKTVPKICHSKSGEINPVKIKSLVEGYIKKYKYLRKKSKRGNKVH